MRARSLAPLLALACLLSVVSPWGPSPYPLPRGEREDLTGTVIRTVDGDTVWVRLAGGVEKVRYIGIDTPEIHHPTRGEEPGGRAATEINRGLVGDRPVRLEPDLQLRDRYGRLLAYVWVRRADCDEAIGNAELLRPGHPALLTGTA